MDIEEIAAAKIVRGELSKVNLVESIPSEKRSYFVSSPDLIDAYSHSLLLPRLDSKQNLHNLVRLVNLVEADENSNCRQSREGDE